MTPAERRLLLELARDRAAECERQARTAGTFELDRWLDQAERWHELVNAVQAEGS